MASDVAPRTGSRTHLLQHPQPFAHPLEADRQRDEGVRIDPSANRMRTLRRSGRAAAANDR
jgi:hypothetical protein